MTKNTKKPKAPKTTPNPAPPVSASAPVAAAPGNGKPDVLEKEDLLSLKVAFLERQNAQLSLQQLQQALQERQKTAQEASATFDAALGVINKKYGLNPSTDKIDLATGAVQRQTSREVG